MTCPHCHSEFPAGIYLCPNDHFTLIKARPDPLIGSTFAERYEVIEVVGRGGMSVVYKARQKYIESFVAIKILNPQLGTDDDTIERFKREAKAASTIRHINVIQILDFGIHPKPFLIMEFLEGDSLADYLEKHGSMETARAINIFMQAADGLAHAHAKGIIHRDLKPGNLVLVEEPGLNEIVKIVDFGIAKVLPKDGVAAQALTQPGEVFGSPLYMSPEQCLGRPLDARSDIYSLGCVMYETLTGMVPLMGENSFETMNMHVNLQPLPLRGAAPGKDIPPLIEKVILKAISKEPENRQQSMLELKKELLESGQQSRLYRNETETYMPGMGDTKGSQSVAETKPETVEKAAEAPSKAMQQLVLDAVKLTRQQDKANKRLRAVLMLVLGVFACALGWLAFDFTRPGPSSDPATLWERKQYLAKMGDGENLFNQGKYAQSSEAYKAAAGMARTFGDGNDKKLRALLGWLTALQDSGASASDINVVRGETLRASLRHMEYLSDHGPKDYSQIVDLDAGLLKKLDPEKLDRATADDYSRELVKNAKEAFAQKSYVKAMSWLTEALESEEQAHGQAGVTDLAAEMEKSPQGKQHAREIHELMQRALEAEKNEESANDNRKK